MNMKKNKTVAILLAAGQGLRFDKEIPKPFIKIAGKPIIAHTLQKFEGHKDINEIIIVAREDLIKKCRDLITQEKFKKVTKIVKGGNTRQESSRIGVYACKKIKPSKILFHDAVRPFVSYRIISEIIEALNKFPAVDVAIPSSDTLIKINEKMIITEIPKRSQFLRGQTPQGFRFDVIKKAHDLALKEKFKEITDDCGLVLKYKLGDVYVVNGEEENIKITYPIDIHIADKLFQIKSINFQGVKNIRFGLEKKNILIFGHSSGIGKEIYKICKKNNANVKGYSLPSIDITNFSKVRDVIRKFVREIGKIDILISTAAILKREKLVNFSFDDIERQIAVNYISQVNLVKEAIPKITKGGSIALFASSSYTRGRETYSIYSSTKAAIVNFVQAVSEEIIEDSIKINTICPARTNTPMRRENFGKEDIKSLLDPKLVAEITLEVCLSDLTGQVININK